MSPHSHKITYQAPLRDMAFLLWEHYRLQDQPGFAGPAAVRRWMRRWSRRAPMPRARWR